MARPNASPDWNGPKKLLLQTTTKQTNRPESPRQADQNSGDPTLLPWISIISTIHHPVIAGGSASLRTPHVCDVPAIHIVKPPRTQCLIAAWQRIPDSQASPLESSARSLLLQKRQRLKTTESVVAFTEPCHGRSFLMQTENTTQKGEMLNPFGATARCVKRE